MRDKNTHTYSKRYALIRSECLSLRITQNDTENDFEAVFNNSTVSRGILGRSHCRGVSISKWERN